MHLPTRDRRPGTVAPISNATGSQAFDERERRGPLRPEALAGRRQLWMPYVGGSDILITPLLHPTPFC